MKSILLIWLFVKMFRPTQNAAPFCAVVNTKDVSNVNPGTRLPSKVRGANLPQEYELARFIENITNPHATWTSSTPACEWQNVFCQDDTYVVVLEWDCLRLSGSVQWMWLPKTVLSCDFSGNNLSGTIPFEVLPQGLASLNVGSNKFFGVLDLSHIVSELDKLYLGDNKFQGCVDLTHLPETLHELRDLIKIQFLYLVGTFSL